MLSFPLVLRLANHRVLVKAHDTTISRPQAFKKARSLGLGDLDFSAVYEVVKGGAGGSGQA
jgi:hypothetical protein